MKEANTKVKIYKSQTGLRCKVQWNALRLLKPFGFVAGSRERKKKLVVRISFMRSIPKSQHVSKKMSYEIVNGIILFFRVSYQRMFYFFKRFTVMFIKLLIRRKRRRRSKKKVLIAVLETPCTTKIFCMLLNKSIEWFLFDSTIVSFHTHTFRYLFLVCMLHKAWSVKT